jgi:hypothetical protein
VDARARPGIADVPDAYFSDVDTAGHDYGPEKPRSETRGVDVDVAVSRLVSGSKPQARQPHELRAVERPRHVRLAYPHDCADDCVDVRPSIRGHHAVVGANPRQAPPRRAYRALKDKHPSLHVSSSRGPARGVSLAQSPRLPAVIGVADDGWHVTTRATLEREKNQVPGGIHARPAKPLDARLFIATGPQFRSSLVVPAGERPRTNCSAAFRQRPAMNDGDPLRRRSSDKKRPQKVCALMRAV